MKIFVDGCTFAIKKILSRPKTPSKLPPVTNFEYITRPTRNIFGLIQGPWRKITRATALDEIFLLSRRNYRVYDNLDIIIRLTRRLAVVLDTCTGSSFSKRYDLPDESENHIKPLKNNPNVNNANKNPLTMTGTIKFAAQLTSHSALLKFYVKNRQ